MTVWRGSILQHPVTPVGAQSTQAQSNTVGSWTTKHKNYYDPWQKIWLINKYFFFMQFWKLVSPSLIIIHKFVCFNYWNNAIIKNNNLSLDFQSVLFPLSSETLSQEQEWWGEIQRHHWRGPALLWEPLLTNQMMDYKYKQW